MDATALRTDHQLTSVYSYNNPTILPADGGGRPLITQYPRVRLQSRPHISPPLLKLQCSDYGFPPRRNGRSESTQFRRIDYSSWSLYGREGYCCWEIYSVH